MSPQEQLISWTLRDGMPMSGDAAYDALHARVLTETPVPADAIVWLQGNGYDRGPKVLDLYRANYAPWIVVTGNRIRSPITVDHLTQWLADRAVPADAILMHDDALHTRDQAVRVLTLAVRRAWRAMLLVASPHHQLRAFLTFYQRAQEVGWGGRIVNQPVACDWNAVPSERMHPAYVVWGEERAKCTKYSDHIATIDAAAASFSDHANHTPHR